MREGGIEIVAEITDEMVDAGAEDPQHAQMLRGLGLGASLVLPLLVRERTIGALVLVNEPGRTIDQDTVDLATDVAQRAAVAIDNSRLFADRAYVASALQRSLLPPKLPDIEALDIAARYVPASFDVGGDFYDLFPLPSGSWVVALGDVCGKGPTAAALTGLIRSALRAIAVNESDPSRILSILNDAMISQLEEPKLFTMVLAVIDPVDGPARMTVCLAGHPRPVKVCVDGSCESAGKRGMLLGVLEEPTLHNSVVTLAPGESIVFYTDGALGKYDAEDPLDFGGRLERLRGFDAATIADEVVARARASSAHDDVAVLVIRSLH